MDTTMDFELKEAAAQTWWIPFVQGLAIIFFGVFAIVNTSATMAFLLFGLGLYWAINGMFGVKYALSMTQDRAWPLISSIGGILIGVFAILQPFVAGTIFATVISSMIGVGAIVSGGVQMAAGRNSWAGIGFGALNVLLGLVILMNPVLSFGVLMAIVAGLAIFGGAALVSIAFAIRALGK